MILTRRGFLAGLGAGLAIGVLPRVSGAAAADGLDPHVLIHIALDGTTTILCPRSEQMHIDQPGLLDARSSINQGRAFPVQADKSYLGMLRGDPA